MIDPEVHRRLTRLEHSVDGNGQPGLKTRMASQEASLKSLENSVSGLVTTIKWMVGLSLSLASVGVATVTLIKSL